jgi:hypothetical protein
VTPAGNDVEACVATTARLRRVAAARAAHPSAWSRHPSAAAGGAPPPERHLVVVKPIRPPGAPEAWSAGLWGSFA